MIFESLYESAQKGELLLIDGGYCRFHITETGQLTIREIIATRKGAGSEMLKILEAKKANSILAKCPAHLEANLWYQKKGFRLVTTQKIKSNKVLNIWVKICE